MSRVFSAAARWRPPVALAAITFSLVAPGTAAATNTTGVFGPVVSEGHQAAEYRGGLGPDSDAFGQRLHYERSLNDDLMRRVSEFRSPTAGPKPNAPRTTLRPARSGFSISDHLTAR